MSWPSGTNAVSGTPIGSSAYNAFLADLLSDLNGARPVSSGGTGATDAATALSNLGGQAANAVATAWEGLSWSSGKMGYATGASTFALVDTKGTGRSILNLDDPNADRIAFFDDSAGVFDYLSLGTGLSISGTTLNLGSALTDLIAVPLSQTVLGRLDDISAFGATLIDDADASAARSTLGLGTAAVKNTGTSGNNVPLLDGANTWSGQQTISGTTPTLALVETDTSTEWNHSVVAGAMQFIKQGVATMTLPALGGNIVLDAATQTLAGKTLSNPTLSGTVAGSPTFSGTPVMGANMQVASGSLMIFIRQNAGLNRIDSYNNPITAAQPLFINSSELQLAINDTIKVTVGATGDIIATSVGPTSVYSLGYRGAPQNDGLTDGNVTLALSDAGGSMQKRASSARNLTIPPNSSVAFPVGTVIMLYNNDNGSGALSVLEGSGVTLYRSDGTAGTGTRTVAQNSMASLYKRNTNEWVISGIFS